MNGISTLKNKTLESLLAFALLSAIGGHNEKMAICKPGSMPSADMGSASVLILNFSASGIVWDAFLLFEPPSLCSSVTA